MTVAQQASLFARNFFTALLPILRQWLMNAKTSYTAMTGLLSTVSGIGAHADLAPLFLHCPAVAWHCLFGEY